MTVGKMIKELYKIQNKYGPRMNVCAEWETFGDEFSHGSIEKIEINNICWVVNDSSELADGTERIKTIISIQGH